MSLYWESRIINNEKFIFLIEYIQPSMIIDAFESNCSSKPVIESFESLLNFKLKSIKN